MKRFFINDFESIREYTEKTIISLSPQVKEHKTVNVLPLLSVPNGEVDKFQGGIFDKDLNFLAGCEGNPFICRESYKIKKKNTEIRDESVIFGGIFFNHFGVMLLLSLTRLWWVIENSSDTRKIIFLCEPNSETAIKYCHIITDLLGISKDRYEIVEKPTVFSNVLIPDEARTNYRKISEKITIPYNEIVNRLLKKYPEKTPEKIYFSRTKFIKPKRNPDGINEEFYEDFYRRRGFEIIYPEQLPIDKQIRLVAGADEFVSTFGTLAHFGPLFLKDGAKQVMLQRADGADRWLLIQIFLLSFRKIDWYLIAATKNPYPTIHDGGVFFYYPTAQFKEYLDNNKIAYNPEELNYTATSEEIAEYVRRWLCIYASPKGFKILKKPELFPVLQALYYQATGKKLDPKDFLS